MDRPSKASWSRPKPSWGPPTYRNSAAGAAISGLSDGSFGRVRVIGRHQSPALLPGRKAIPRRAASPGGAEGFPSRAEGIPSRTEGNPNRAEGNPSPAEGNPNV